MTVASYVAIAFLQQNSDFDLEVTLQRLRKRFPQESLSLGGKEITLDLAGWKIHVSLADDPAAAAETREIAEAHPDSSRAAEIIECTRYVEIYAPEPDDNRKHFDDFVAVCTIVETSRGVVLVDPATMDMI